MSSRYYTHYNLKGNTQRYYADECPVCSAGLGEPCRKPSFNWSPPHAARIKLAQDHTTHTIFVYGTLKRGYGNYERLLKNATFLGDAISVDVNYQMTAGGFPFLAKTKTGHAVKGQLFRVNAAQFAACDRLEGHPHFYHREEHLFKLPSGEQVKAWVYLCDRGLNSAGHMSNGLCVIKPNWQGELEWNRIR
jgi:gamma-glutamylaminecyclotransferase